MSGRDIDGAYKTDPGLRLVVQLRRAELRDAKRCINGPLVGNVGRHGVVHGEVVAGGKCQRCIDVYRRSSS